MKCGLKTFPLSVDLDDNIKLVEAEFGVKGFAIVIKLYQAIYSRGYYMKWDIDAQLLFIRDYCLSEVGRGLVSEVVDCCIRRGVFESKLYNEHKILTSKRIQETFLTATKRSNKVVMEEQYALPIVYEFIESVNKNGKNVNISFKNVDNFEQRKGKERKEKEITPNPLQGGGSDFWKDKFFERYTVFEKKNYHDDGVDYEVLYREFEQSATLQKMWSFPKVVKLYQQIANGDFRDKQQPTYVAPAVSAANARADREKFYAQRRNAAQAKADKMMERAMHDNDFKQAAHRISWMQAELARAEVNGDKDKLRELTRQQAILQSIITDSLKALGLTEKDLKPQWYCKKCSDTGYLPNGTACDCYKK